DNNELIIERITKTNYQDYSKKDIENDVYGELLNLEYNSVVVSFEFFLNYIVNKKVSLRIKDEYLNLEFAHLESWEGNQLEENDIIISENFANSKNLFKNSKLDLTLSGNVSNIITEIELPTLTIKGFCDEKVIYFNFFDNYELIKKIFFDNSRLIYELNDSYYDLRNEYSVDNFALSFRQLSKLIRKNKEVFLVAALFGIVVVSLLCVNYLEHILAREKKNIFILFSLGYEKKTILKLFLIGLFFLIFVAFIIASIITIIFALKINEYNPYLFKTFWFQFRFYYLLIILIFLVLIFSLSMIFIFRKNKKKSLAQNIRIS
ncbi:MAG: FtsX-like permease family protein, partial [Bacilli bacterium]|nr:FtsX-like permease family protein [Bacilli bacterium]